MFRLLAFIFFASFCTEAVFAAAEVRVLAYGGRITDTNGKPVKGPIDLRVEFYHSLTETTSVGNIGVDFPNVKLTDGLFSIEIALTDAEWQLIFPNVSQKVYVQVINLTDTVNYPRQQYSIVPYALKVPVDGKTITFNSKGQLSLGDSLTLPVENQTFTVKLKASTSTSSDIVYTLPAAPMAGKLLSTDAGGQLVWIDPGVASGGTLTGVTAGTGLTGGGTIGSLTIAIANNGVDSAQIKDGAVTSAKILDNTIVDADISSISTAKISGLGTAASLNAGTNTNNLLQLSASGVLPALDASALTNLDPTKLSASVAVSKGGTGLTTLGTANQLLGANAGGTAYEAKSVVGTTNQITVTHAANAITLSTPQSIATTSTPTFGALTLNGVETNAGIIMGPAGTGVGGTSVLKFNELAANGSNYVAFKAPDSITADKTWILPGADGTNGQVLTTNGTGTLSWATPATSSGDITDVIAGTGLTGGAASGAATLNLTNTGVTAASYTRANVTVDAQGRLTAASNGAAINLASEVSGQLPIANGGTGLTATGANGEVLTVASGVPTFAKIDKQNLVASALSNQIYGVNNTGNSMEAKTISGTANQIIVTNGTGTLAFSTPQDIATTSSPTFAGAKISGITSSILKTDASGTLAAATGSDLTTLIGTLAIAKGGTGATTQAAALNAILPTQSSNSGKVLTTDGTNSSWAAASSQWTTTGSDVYYNAGKVGIGTTTPSALLDVKGSGGGSVQAGPWTGATTYGAIYLNDDFGNSSNYNLLSIAGVASHLYLNRPSGKNISFREANGAADQMTLLTGGNVGIGTTVPGAALHVAYGAAKTSTVEKMAQEWSSNEANGRWGLKVSSIGNASQANRVYILQTHEQGVSNSGNISLQPYGGYVGIGTTSPTSALQVTDGDGTINIMGQVVQSSTRMYLKSGGGLSIDLQPNGSTMLSASTTGVGIGAAASSNILYTVASGAKTANYSGNLFTTTATSSTASVNKYGVEIQSTGTWNGTSANNVGLYVSAVTGGTNNYDAIFNGGGNVGIGTTSPGYKLDVNGTANFAGNVTIGGNLTLPSGSALSNVGAGSNSEHFGAGSTAAGADSVAIGNTASAAATGTVAIGSNASASTGQNIAIGNGASASGSGVVIAMGAGASATGGSSLVLGNTANTGSGVTVLGVGALATGNFGLSAGSAATAGASSTALGANTVASGTGSVAIGSGSTTASFSFATAIGYAAVATAANQFVGGSSYSATTNVFFGNGVSDAAPAAYTINGTSGSGTNIAGAALQLAGGQGTGTGVGGSIIFKTSAAGSTGTATNALAERMRIDSAGNVGIGTTNPGAALQTTITSASVPAFMAEQKGAGDIAQFKTSAGLAIKMAATTDGAGIYFRRTDTNATVGSIYWENGTGPLQQSQTVFNDGLKVGSYATSYFSGPISTYANRDLKLNPQSGYDLTVNTSSLVVKDTTGYVGIGTTSPSAALEVKGQIVTTLPATLAPSGTTQTINFANGNVQVLDLNSASGNVTLTLSGPVAGGMYAIKIIQGATARTLTWPATVKWPNGTAITLSTSSAAIDVVSLFYDGTNYLAVGGNNFY